MGLKVIRVYKALKGLKVILVLKDQKVTLVQRAPRDHKVFKA